MNGTAKGAKGAKFLIGTPVVLEPRNTRKARKLEMWKFFEMNSSRGRANGWMRRAIGGVLLGVLFSCVAVGEDDFGDLKSPAHGYWDRPLKDPFSLRMEEFRDGTIPLDRSSERAFLRSLLEEFEIPISSQLLVFSTTSLQLRLISPRNPRAIYFDEDVYIGFIPGGRIEIISMDPDLGGIFYIFDIPSPGPKLGERPIVFERSDRCMNCHSDAETRNVPGLTIRSVIPGPRGGSMDSFRRDQNGHQIAIDQRFGGWHVTGDEGFGKHWGNVIGNYTKDGLVTSAVPPGREFDFSRYLTKTSDLLPHLILEHQAGFVNVVLEASYRARYYEDESEGKLTPEQNATLDRMAGEVVLYLLFAEEAALPGKVKGDAAYREAFLQKRKTDAAGRSLRDFDLKTRIFKYRCSYMVYSNVFIGMPDEMRNRVKNRLRGALTGDGNFDYLPDEEKRAILSILRETLPDFGDL